MTAVESLPERRKRDERYQELVELAPDSILIHDGERIVLANAAAVRLAGATCREEVIGLPIDALLDPPHLKAVQAGLTDFVSPTADAPPVRDSLRRLDGTRVAVEVRAIAFMEAGRPSAHLVIRDITERIAMEDAARQVEERLEKAQRMEAVGALAGGVAHEVNNMMAVVLGFSDFLLRDQRLPTELAADVREIVVAADRAAAVTRQLLAFSRRAVQHPKVVALAAAVHDAEPVVRRLLGAVHQLAVTADASPLVRIDPQQLQQVIVNLALNARDAMAAGGTFTMTTGEAALPAGIAAVGGASIPAGRYALLMARDTGTGMDAATLARIFEPFFTTKPIGQGTGLGLAAAHGIVTQSGGYITVSTTPGHGATFTVYLPVVTQAGPVDRDAPPPAGRESVRAESMVLVVDDEPAVRAIAARSLEYGGFRVLQAPDGADALQLIDRYGPPDIVLTDLLMPGVGGAELARRLKERWPSLPVVFMSGYSAEELRRQGAIDFDGELIQKPFTPDGLVTSVAAALARTGAAQPAGD